MSASQTGAEQSELLRLLTRYSLVGGVAGLVFGLIHWVGIATVGFTTTRLADALINTLLGVMALSCWRLLVGRRRHVVAVWAGLVVVALIYPFAMGRGLNLVAAVLGAAVLALFLALWRRGELV